jgi:hypothetical protein
MWCFVCRLKEYLSGQTGFYKPQHPGVVNDIAASRFMIDVEFFFVLGAGTSTLRSRKCRGAFGVPTFVVGDEMFWGNDCLVLLEHRLGCSLSASESNRQIPSASL